jgi:hypothetical protein
MRDDFVKRLILLLSDIGAWLLWAAFVPREASRFLMPACVWPGCFCELLQRALLIMR